MKIVQKFQTKYLKVPFKCIILAFSKGFRDSQNCKNI